MGQKEVKEKKPSQIRESVFLTKLIGEKQQTLEELKAIIDPEKERLQREFASFTAFINDKRGYLLKEVSDLEERKRKALEPLDELEYKLGVKQAELEDLEQRLNERQKTLDKERSGLVEGLEFLGEKKSELGGREKNVLKQEQGLKLQKDLARDSMNDLNQKWEKFHFETAQKQLELLEHDRKNFEKEQALDVVRESLDKKETELLKYKTQLDDRQKTLEVSWAELRNNGRNIRPT